MRECVCVCGGGGGLEREEGGVKKEKRGLMLERVRVCFQFV